MKNNLVLIVIVSVLVGAGLGFFGGVQYQKSKVPTFARFSGGGGQNFRGANGQLSQRVQGNFRPVTGQIIASDTNSITVKLPDGSSKIVFLTNTTAINQAAQATPADLAAGKSVAVFGQTNSDGSVTAQNIQLNPEFRQVPLINSRENN
jgi:hypothetical protein